MASISVYNKSSTSFSVKLTGLQTDGVTYTRKCQWSVREKSTNNSMGSGTTYIEPGNTEGGDITFSGLSQNTAYSVSCTVYRTDSGAYLTALSTDVTTSSSGDSGGGGTEGNFKYQISNIGIVTNAYEETVFVGSYAAQVYELQFATSGVAKFYSVDSGDTFGWLEGFLYLDPEYGQTSDDVLVDDDNDGQGYNFYFEYDVVAGTTYYFYVGFSYIPDSGYINICIEPPISLPTVAKWSWKTTSDSAVSGTIKNQAYNAVVNKTATSNFDYRVWNAIVDKVKEILDKCEYEWYTLYDTYANTKMTSTDKTLTATRFNSLRYNIGSRYSTGIQEVEPGDVVYGEYFITLADCINEWIDVLRNNGQLGE